MVALGVGCRIENSIKKVNGKWKAVGFCISKATLPTVGYGDVYPITIVGKFFFAIITLIGIHIVALPTGIISSVFIEKMQNEKAKDNKVCIYPKCGTTIKVDV